MIVHFEGVEYQFDLEDIDVSQARHIKRQTGLSIKGFLDGVSELDADAIVAAYWLMQVQNGTRVDMNKVNFKVVRFAEAVGEAIEADEKAKAELENPTDEPSEAQP